MCEGVPEADEGCEAAGVVCASEGKRGRSRARLRARQRVSSAFADGQQGREKDAPLCCRPPDAEPEVVEPRAHGLVCLVLARLPVHTVPFSICCGVCRPARRWCACETECLELLLDGAVVPGPASAGRGVRVAQSADHLVCEEFYEAGVDGVLGRVGEGDEVGRDEVGRGGRRRVAGARDEGVQGARGSHS